MYSKIKNISMRVLACLMTIAMLLTVVSTIQPALAVDPGNIDPLDPILGTEFKTTQINSNLWKATYTITPKQDQIPESSDIIVILDYSSMMNLVGPTGESRLQTAKKGLTKLVDELIGQAGTKNRMSIILQGAQDGANVNTKMAMEMTDDKAALLQAIQNIPEGSHFLQDYSEALDLAKDELERVVDLDDRAGEGNYNKKKTVLWMTAAENAGQIPSNFNSAMTDLGVWNNNIKNKVSPYDSTDIDFELYSLGIGNHVAVVPEAMVQATGGDLDKNYLKCLSEADFEAVIAEFGKAVLNVVQNANATFSVNKPFYIIDNLDTTYAPKPQASFVGQDPDSANRNRINFTNIPIAKPTVENPSTVLEFYISIHYNGGGSGRDPILDLDGGFTYDKNDGKPGGKDEPEIPDVPTNPELTKYKISYETSDAKAGTLTHGITTGQASFPNLVEKTAEEALAIADIPTPVVKGTGYEFKGWKDKADATGTILPTVEGVKVTQNTTFVAVFGKKSYQITFELNGGTIRGSTNAISGTVEDSVVMNTVVPFNTVVDPTPPANSKFVGWIKTGDATNTLIQTSAIVGKKVYDTATYTAQYTLKDATVQYTVKNNIGGTLTGTTTYPNIQFGVTVGRAGTIPTPVPSVGYSFSHWEVNNAATKYNDAQVQALLVNTDPYVIQAVFVKEQKTVTFDKNGGTLASGMGASQSVEYGAKAIGVKNPTPPDASKTFSYWEDTKGNQYSSADIMSKIVTEDITYKAVYGVTQVSVKFESANTAQGTVQAVGTYTMDYNSSLTEATKAIPTTKPATGYEFSHWSINGTTVTNLEAYKFTNPTTTVVANFKKAKYTVTFDANTGTLASGMGASQTVDFNDKATNVKNPTPADASKTFSYWAGTDGSKISSADVMNKSVTADITYKAVYGVTQIEVKFKSAKDAEGKVDGTGTYTIAYNTALTTIPTTKPAAGYEFSHWTIEGQAGEVTTAELAGKKFTNPTTTVVANFKKIEYTVTFDADTGTLASGMGVSQILNYNDKATNVKNPIPADISKTFSYWAGTDGSKISSADVMNKPVTADITYKAVYGITQINVNFKSADTAKGTVQNVGTYTMNYNGSLTSETKAVPTTTPATNYVLSHWTIEGETSEFSTAQLETYKFTRNTTTVSAVFKLNAFDVTYDATEGSLPAGHLGVEKVTLGDSPKNVPVVIAPTGKAFDYWTTDGRNQYSNDQVKTHVINSPVTYKAIYADDSNNDGIPDKYQYKYTLNFKARVPGINFTTGSGTVPSENYQPIVVLGGDSRINNANVNVPLGYTAPVPKYADGRASLFVWDSDPQSAVDPDKLTVLSPDKANQVTGKDREYEITFTAVSKFTVEFYQAQGTKIDIDRAIEVESGEHVSAQDEQAAETPVKAGGRGQPFDGWTDQTGKFYPKGTVKAIDIKSNMKFTAHYVTAGGGGGGGRAG